MKYRPLAITTLLVAVLLLSSCAYDDAHDETSGASADHFSDDSADDAASDDDSGSATVSPYDGMTPAGITIDEMLAVASHMSTGAEYDEAREFEIEKAVEAGATHSRRGFYWPSIEPADGEWTFDGYDAMVDLLTEAGIKPLAFLTRFVEWAAPGGGPNDIDPADWADFAGTVAARYAGRVERYEIWNEENSPAFWDEPSPEHYGDLLKAAYTAIHAADGSATVMLGGLSPFDPNLLDRRGIWNFIARLGRAHPDICDYMDAIAIHPYTFLQQPGPEFSLDLGIYRYPDLRGNIEEARGLLESIGCADKPIHLTEMGWPDTFIGEDRQAAYLARGLMLARAAGAESYYWYTFFNENDVAAMDFPTDGWFGLFTNPSLGDPQAKPSYLALLGAHRTIGASHYAGDLGAALNWSGGNYATAFADDAGNWTIGLWHEELQLNAESTASVPFPPGAAGDWSLYDQNGELTGEGAVGEGELSITLSGRVQYLRVTVAL